MSDREVVSGGGVSFMGGLALLFLGLKLTGIAMIVARCAAAFK